jgi:tRNA threonylcarbamoyladenosine biosynthesis protein TsaB
MNILYLDTAMGACGVSVYNSKTHEVEAVLEQTSRGQAEKLVPFIDEVIAKAGLNPEALEAIAVTIGPGSFTGVRIALAAAQAMSSALDIPLIGLTTLDVIAKQAQEDAQSYKVKNVAVILETKRSDYYVQVFRVSDSSEITKPLALEINETLDLLKEHEENGLICAGDALQRLQNEESFQQQSLQMQMIDITAPDPRIAVKFAASKIDKATREFIAPLYLRSADVSQPKKTFHIAEK